jgi:nicotinic acid mononucleotide adenylyltransferase
MPSSAVATWESLDGGRVEWVHRVAGHRVVVLLGAFDPPTNAHLAILDAAMNAVGAPGALCMTKVLLARGDDQLLPLDVRVDVLDAIARRLGIGLCFADRGTYLDVGREMAKEGVRPVFVVGADKLAQLSDPSFYADGEDGVRATFDELELIVVPRDGTSIPRDDVVVLGVDEVFGDDAQALLSATEVRKRVRAGESVVDLVPPGVALAIEGYTRTR